MKISKVLSVAIAATLLLVVGVSSASASTGNMNPCDRRIGQRLNDCDDQPGDDLILVVPTDEPIDDVAPNPEPPRDPIDDVREPLPNPDPQPIDDYEAPSPEQPVLCHMEVGIDAAEWGGQYDVDWGWFYFEATPWEPLPEGTPIWGVAMVAPGHSLVDANNVFAVTTDMSVYQDAHDSGDPATYNYPSIYGGIESGGEIWYRNHIDFGDAGECGPIVAVDDITVGGGVLDLGGHMDYVISGMQ